jgi:branched-chain amino acid aminotransferase
VKIEKVDWIWFNGKFVPWEEAKIHVLTYSFQYGGPVFEGIRFYESAKGSVIFRLKDHIKRLFDSAKVYRIKIPYTKEEIASTTVELIKKNKLKEGYIRPLVYRGFGEIGLNPLNSPVEVAISAFPFGAYLGEKGLKEGVRCLISSWKRAPPECLPLKAKVGGNYLTSHLAKMEAVSRGFDEAILLDSRGFISEGSGENIFLVKEGIIYTPPQHASILLGITRDSIIKISRELGYKVVEQDLTKEDLYNADEAFFTGTAAEVTPIKEVDERLIGDGKPGKITKELQNTYFSLVRIRLTNKKIKRIYSKYSHWFTLVK